MAMSFNPMGPSLAVLRSFAGSELAQRLGIVQPAQVVVQHATRAGFRLASTVAQQLKNGHSPSRLPSAEKQRELFDLNLNEEQQMMRDMAQRFATEVLRPSAAAANEARKPPDGYHAQVAELGFAQLVVPGEFGGAATEQAIVTQALVAEALAQGDMGLAVAALAPLGVANVLSRWGSAAQQAKYLPAFASESPPAAALAIGEPRPAFDPGELKTRATIDADGFVLHGQKSLVPLAEDAELFLVAANLVGKGPQLFVVEAGTPGLSIRPEPAMGVRAARLGRLTLDGARLPQSALLGENVDVVDYQKLVDLSRLAWCALSLGTAQAVLEYVIPYCNERIAFNEPVSHRQAVAFMIANIAIELDGMRLLTWRAASRAELGLSFHREAYLARTLCAEKAVEIGTNGVQLLGGHGFIKEHPVERFYRDLLAMSVLEGGLAL
jgi:hypothetical protein